MKTANVRHVLCHMGTRTVKYTLKYKHRNDFALHPDKWFQSVSIATI